MKHKITKKIILDCQLDSSESIMFNQGGRHTLKIDAYDLLIGDLEDEDFLKPGRFETSNIEIEINFQMDRSHKSRFDFINGEANAHKQRMADENKLP